MSWAKRCRGPGGGAPVPGGLGGAPATPGGGPRGVGPQGGGEGGCRARGGAPRSRCAWRGSPATAWRVTRRIASKCGGKGGPMTEKQLARIFGWGTAAFVIVLAGMSVDTLGKVPRGRTPPLTDQVVAGKAT